MLDGLVVNINIKKMIRLLQINTAEHLTTANICRNQWLVSVLNFFGIKLRPKYIVGVKVTYADKSTKTFDVFYWMAFREGILQNLYAKGLCKIKFITSFEQKQVQVDEKTMKVVHNLIKNMKKV